MDTGEAENREWSAHEGVDENIVWNDKAEFCAFGSGRSGGGSRSEFDAAGIGDPGGADTGGWAEDSVCDGGDRNSRL